MFNAVKFLITVLLCVNCLPAQTPAGEESAKAVVLQKNEGEVRTRRPREGVASPTSDFVLKISPHQCPDLQPLHAAGERFFCARRVRAEPENRGVVASTGTASAFCPGGNPYHAERKRGCRSHSRSVLAGTDCSNPGTHHHQHQHVEDTAGSVCEGICQRA